jgi:hypothetical protein
VTLGLESLCFARWRNGLTVSPMRAALVGLGAAGFLGVLLGAHSSAAQLRAEEHAAETDDFELSARADTYAALFRRALLPGAAGSLVDTETAAPVHEYVSVRAQRVDAGPLEDGLDLEVSAWGRLWPTETAIERPLDGDVQTAFATLRFGPGFLRLGRQHFVGGAARFARFDGLAMGASLAHGFDLEGYAGFTVLPRWDSRPGYHHLGAEADTLLRDAEALEQPARAGHWLSGARVGYRGSVFSGAASFHEQREGGDIARRNLGLDARVKAAWAALGLSTILDTDSLRLADARIWAELSLVEDLSLSIEYLHTEPALWLSRQSVLSVFSTDRFDEAGGVATLRLSRRLRLEGSAFLTIYDEHRPGARSEGTLRLAPDERSLIRLSYVRVLAPRNGYHSLRTSLSRRLFSATVGTLEAYGYFYDHSIQSYRASSVYAATLSRQLSAPWSLLVGGSLARTPYAGLDAQALVRLSYAIDQTQLGIGL